MRIRTGLAILPIAIVALTPARVSAEASGFPPAASAPLLAWPENFSRTVQGTGVPGLDGGRVFLWNQPAGFRCGLDPAGRPAHPAGLGRARTHLQGAVGARLNGAAERRLRVDDHRRIAQSRARRQRRAERRGQRHDLQGGQRHRTGGPVLGRELQLRRYDGRGRSGRLLHRGRDRRLGPIADHRPQPPAGRRADLDGRGAGRAYRLRHPHGQPAGLGHRPRLPPSRARAPTASASTPPRRPLPWRRS